VLFQDVLLNPKNQETDVPCPLCKRNFSQRKSLTEHMQVLHTDHLFGELLGLKGDAKKELLEKQLLFCGDCPQRITFKAKSALNRHRERFHTDSPKATRQMNGSPPPESSSPQVTPRNPLLSSHKPKIPLLSSPSSTTTSPLVGRNPLLKMGLSNGNTNGNRLSPKKSIFLRPSLAGNKPTMSLIIKKQAGSAPAPVIPMAFRMNKCTFCQKSFTRDSILNVHVDMVHQKEKKALEKEIRERELAMNASSSYEDTLLEVTPDEVLGNGVVSNGLGGDDDEEEESEEEIMEIEEEDMDLTNHPNLVEKKINLDYDDKEWKATGVYASKKKKNAVEADVENKRLSARIREKRCTSTEEHKNGKEEKEKPDPLPPTKKRKKREETVKTEIIEKPPMELNEECLYAEEKWGGCKRKFYSYFSMMRHCAFVHRPEKTLDLMRIKKMAMLQPLTAAAAATTTLKVEGATSAVTTTSRIATSEEEVAETVPALEKGGEAAAASATYVAAEKNPATAETATSTETSAAAGGIDAEAIETADLATAPTKDDGEGISDELCPEEEGEKSEKIDEDAVEMEVVTDNADADADVVKATD
jgi:hypothetical protein